LIETCLSEFWVDLDGLGLGFHRRRREKLREEERTVEKREKQRKKMR